MVFFKKSFLLFKSTISLILGIFLCAVILLLNRHPSTGSQYSSMQFGEQVPPHFSPNEPRGQDVLQNSPKNPGGHAVKTKYTISILVQSIPNSFTLRRGGGTFDTSAFNHIFL